MNRLKGYLTEDPKGIDRLALIAIFSALGLVAFVVIIPAPKKPGHTCIIDGGKTACFRTGGVIK